MKHPLLILFSFSSILILLSSCEYRLKDDYYRELNKRYSAEIHVSLNDIDTAFNLIGNMAVEYTATTDDLEILYIKCFIDGNPYESISGNHGYIGLHSAGYEDGWHSIDIIVTTHSGTGSLADLVGAEGFQYQRSWNFYVAKSPPVPVSIKRIYNNNGALTIEWDRYTLFDFDKYEVLKTDRFASSTIFASINNPEKTSFEDLTFIGGTATYNVRVYSKNGSFTVSSPFAFTDSMPVISSRWIKDNQIELSWPRCNYPKAFQSYNIENYNTNYKFEIFEINTTSITGNYCVLHLPVRFSFYLKSKKDYGSVVSTTDLYAGEPFVRFSTFLKNEVNQTILLSWDGTLYRYDLATKRVSDSIVYGAGVPTLIYSPADDVLLETNPLQKRNPVTLDITGSFQNQTVLSTNLSGSSWGLAILNGSTVLFDYVNMAVVKTLNFKSNNIIQISNDNQYLFELIAGSSLNCYKIDGNNVILQWSKACVDFKLIPGKPDQVIILENTGNAAVTEIATNKALLTFHAFVYSPKSIIDIDYATKTLVTGEGNYGNVNIHLINFETGQLIKTVICYVSNVNTKNGKLFFSGGYINVN